MAAETPSTEPSLEATAQRTTDRLALALEEVGFDVGRAFPMLRSCVDREDLSVIELGRVTEEVAASLSALLMRAARQGVTLPP